jgi:hypothetical protein
MPPPSIKNESYPQAKQCASVEVPAIALRDLNRPAHITEVGEPPRGAR